AMIYFDAKQFEGKDTHDLEGVIYFHNGDKKYRLEVSNISTPHQVAAAFYFQGIFLKFLMQKSIH
ncbi:hypothetical protein ACFQUX_29180, partial [Pantoea stewartii]